MTKKERLDRGVVSAAMLAVYLLTAILLPFLHRGLGLFPHSCHRHCEHAQLCLSHDSPSVGMPVMDAAGHVLDDTEHQCPICSFVSSLNAQEASSAQFHSILSAIPEEVYAYAELSPLGFEGHSASPRAPPLSRNIQHS